MCYFKYPIYLDNKQCFDCSYCIYSNKGYPYGNVNMYRNDSEAINVVTLEEQALTPSKFKLVYPIITSGTNELAEATINSEIIDEVSNLFKNQVLLSEKTEFDEVNGFYDIKLNENYKI